MWRYLPSPISDLPKVSDILESDYHRMSEDDAAFKKAVKLFTRQLLVMPISDYFHHLLNAKYHPVFDVYANYHSLETSIICIKNWLKFQFGFGWRLVLQSIYDVAIRGITKKRTLWFTGPANSGKTYVMKSLASLFILVGNIKNLVGKGQFPFQDLLGKIIFFLDELRIPKEYEDEFKDILAGQSMTIVYFLMTIYTIQYHSKQSEFLRGSYFGNMN